MVLRGPGENLNMKLIIYTSQSKIADDSIDKELGNIIATAKEFNSKKDITGVLFYENRHFLQVLEGPENEVTSLLETICKDARHKSITILVDIQIKRRTFPSWSMGKINLEKSHLFNADMLKKLRDAYQENFIIDDAGFIQYLEALLNNPEIEQLIEG
jgi:hypothetical protein